MSARVFDIGDPEPEGVVVCLADYRADDYKPDFPESWHPYWSRIEHDVWKGYTDGCKTYLTWDELVRRYGPLRQMGEA